jgi:hypothetical protein
MRSDKLLSKILSKHGLDTRKVPDATRRDGGRVMHSGVLPKSNDKAIKRDGEGVTSTFNNLVAEETARVRLQGCSARSWHEAYGLLLEEVSEFFDEVKKRPAKRDRMNALKELVQIAGICGRTAVDLGLIDDYEKAQEKANRK